MDPNTTGVLGLVFGFVFGFLLAWKLKVLTPPPLHYVPCPRCFEAVHAGAKVCKHCRSSLVPVPQIPDIPAPPPRKP